ncbi:hypothetical protein N788_11665 [Arenimonas donghaensis DSM 18148 = HO3-R19]|uniref:YNCE-like beta-propeller domain-containing protein n=1 Tax=Arenimonas donghaensis DSM 18148 = HO3-R19 TaxID=1121014 RepID=A0A087MJK6_9GAMM|nr:hypothetical protein N788_11665 [Arenimonas donghaensis DSM 18148 = HO3-R19]
MFAVLLLGASQVAAQPYAYVSNSATSDVDVIDSVTQTVVTTIPVGSGAWGVAASPDGTRVYVPNPGSNNVSVIDTSTNTVTATVPVGASPYGATVSPDGAELYVTNLGSGNVSVIDTSTNTVVATVPGFANPYFLDFTPDGSRVLVADVGSNAVYAIDTGTRTIVQTYVTANNPFVVQVTPDGSKAYATSGGGSPAASIDLGTGVVTSIAGTGSNGDVAFLPDSSIAYLTNWSVGGVLLVDTGTDTVVQTIPTAANVIGASMRPDGTQLYVTNRNTGEVYIIDVATNTIVNTVAVGGSPYAMGDMFAAGAAAPPIAQGVQLDAVPGAPVIYAEEIIASPGSPVTLLNPAGDLNLSANLGYNFSIGEVRYARFECDNGLVFNAGSAATYDGTGSAGLGAINGLGGSAMHFSITANDNNVVASDRLVIEGDRQIIGTADDINCRYSLYDFPSQAAAGGSNGRVYTVSGPYIRFAASYALEVDSQGSPIADVESGIPAFAEFVVEPPTNDSLLGNLGGFSYGTRLDMGLGAQPLTPAGAQITLADLMHPDTALVFEGDFSSAADVFFSPLADCSVNIQSADDFSQVEAVFTIGSADALDHQLCFLADGATPIAAGEYTVSLDAVPAAPAVFAVTDLGPFDLGAITRNGTELQAPLAQVPGGWISRIVLTNSGPVGRAFRIEVFGETGNVISTSGPMSGVIEAEATRVIDLDGVLTGFTGAPRATVKLTVAAPSQQIQGLYQIVNPDSGSISNHVMVRPGTN